MYTNHRSDGWAEVEHDDESVAVGHKRDHGAG